MPAMLGAMDLPQRIEPGPGQESVWDYPRPPRLEVNERHLQVVVAGVVIADSTGGYRVCETSQPPAFYLPPDDVRTDLLAPTTSRTFCEWKGQARYWTIRVPDADERRDAAWSYDSPRGAFGPIAGHLAFYPQRVDACFVDGEPVERMDGAFYGGWITSEVVGPFKGAAGTLHW